MSSSSRRSFLSAASLVASAAALGGSRVLSQASPSVDAQIEVMPGETVGTIAPEFYGHFIEQLGGVIYDGVWVGKGSKVANEQGVRKAFLETMRSIKAPVMRWPGGCFADSYDWRDGIGPVRPQRTAFWSQEDSNQFGLHEFMFTCKAIGCEPYLAADMRSMPAKDFYQLVEYCNAPAGMGNALAAQREKNGSRDPFLVKFWGVGNESWGCGGNMTPEEYAHEWRKYSTWLPTYEGQKPLELIAVGPNGYDLDWTRRLFPALNGHLPWGLSTHYYVSGDAKKFAAGDALSFSSDEYYDLLARATTMERILKDHWLMMQTSDPAHKVKFVVDEWGSWYGPSSKIGEKYNLSQVPTMRDALLSGLTLDIFQRNAEKVGMACVAQTINCLHSLMLASGDKFVTTPIYEVFKMYMPHMGGQSVRTEFAADALKNPLAQLTPVGGNSADGSIPAERTVPSLSGSASRTGGKLTLSVVNTDLTRPMTARINLRGVKVGSAQGTVLAAEDVHAHNSFERPHEVQAKATTVAAAQGGEVLHTFPAGSVTVLVFVMG